jgi:Excreted virulence factor EspC, type VII ESX diderm
VAGGYQVITEALVGHATNLGRVHDQLATALGAAQQVSMPRDAYGVICQFFPPMIDPIEQSGVDALSAGVQSVTDTAGAVNQTARDYDAVETTNASSFSPSSSDGAQ